ncbi:YwhD family protein [Bacillaceae bacterium]
MDLLHHNKRKGGLTIVSGTNTHGGFGAGMVDMSNLAAVIIDGDEAYIDMGAIHAKSKVERGIKFSPNKDDVPNGKPYWVVWVAVDRGDQGPYYAGVTACYMEIDREARRGYKILADHVNKMDYALKRRIIVDELDERAKAALRRLLMTHNERMWQNSSAELKRALATDGGEEGREQF